MEFYDKLLERFHDLLKVKNPGASKAKVKLYLELSTENVLRNDAVTYALPESS